jgi:hypothetical protein
MSLATAISNDAKSSRSASRIQRQAVDRPPKSREINIRWQFREIDRDSGYVSNRFHFGTFVDLQSSARIGR